jgi:hypothetical protein
MLECHGVANLGWATRTGTAGPKGHVTRPEIRLADANMSAARLCDRRWGPSADGSLVGKRRGESQVIWQSPFETCSLSAAGQCKYRGPRRRAITARVMMCTWMEQRTNMEGRRAVEKDREVNFSIALVRGACGAGAHPWLKWLSAATPRSSAIPALLVHAARWLKSRGALGGCANAAAPSSGQRRVAVVIVEVCLCAAEEGARRIEQTASWRRTLAAGVPGLDWARGAVRPAVYDLVRALRRVQVGPHAARTPARHGRRRACKGGCSSRCPQTCEQFVRRAREASQQLAV